MHFVFSDVEVLGEHYLSSQSRSQRSNTILAKWYNSASCSTELDFTCKVGEIDTLFSHNCNLHCNDIDELNFGELLDIFIEKALIWIY